MQPHDGKNALNPACRHLSMQPHDGKNALNPARRHLGLVQVHSDLRPQAKELAGTGT